MIHLISYIIKIYQVISRTFLPKACRFYPSCSEYSLESVKKYGVCKGLAKAAKRIIRCSPFTKGGYDPVG